jgi:predicted CXXCH cytochrome family protein
MKVRILSLIQSTARVCARKSSRRGFIAGGIMAALFGASCATTDRTVMLPPAVAGATFVGSGECALCHSEIMDDFHTASHAMITMHGKDGTVDIGCESCHGPGSLHVESGGELAGTIHKPGNSAAACFQCHIELQGVFHLASAHPVADGRMTCTDCHDPHKGSAIMGGGTALHAENDSCFTCHSAQRGPHAFEHEAMRDGCTVCHDVHGSVNPKLLKARGSNLCLQCHMVDRTGTTATGAPIVMIGGRDHAAFLARGSCWVAGCHEAVHGSNASSSLRF